MKLPYVIDGKYRLESRIGRGNFGSVYKALDERLGRQVAVKIISWDSSDQDFLETFERESRSLARLNHGNVVTVHDFGECPEGPFMVMEFVEGTTLESMVATGPLDQRMVIELYHQVAVGMEHVHANRIIHRDLSLNNIMVGRSEQGLLTAKIVDFGLVKFLGAATGTKGLSGLGTPSYMAPEQIVGEALDHRADIFAFGVGLFRMLHGRFPFEAEHPAAVAYLIMYENVPDCDPTIDAGLRELVHHCLQKSKEDRPEGFHEIVQRFEKMKSLPSSRVDRQPESQRPVERPVRSSKRNPFLNRVMIRSRQEFVGRDKEVRRIYSRIDASHPQSVSIVGERRIGKSTLLNFIYNKNNRREFMTNSADSLFVYLDFQRMADFTVDRFVQFLFGVLELESGRSLGLDESCGLEALRDAVKKIHDSGKRIIILMDEFEVITGNERFEADFFSFLRSLANSYRVAYVTSSCDELQQLCHNQDISDSPFFNIFSNLPLRAFTPEEARRLVVEQSEREGLPLEAWADRIIGLAGCFPIFVQIASSALFEEMLDVGDGEPNWSHVESVFMDEAAPHFEFFWEHCTPEERENLARIVRGAPTSRKFAFINESLQRRGYLKPQGSSYVMTSTALAQFISKHEGFAGGGKLKAFFARFRR